MRSATIRSNCLGTVTLADNLTLINLAHALGEALRRRSWMIGAAESCTGGLLLSTLTDVPGSSAYVQGGVVVYSNAMKAKLLGVHEATLAAYGAVSEPVAREMATGALALLGAQMALSVTGIAGPGGGSAEKPVGLVYIGAAWSAGQAVTVEVRRCQWAGSREENKRQSVAAALELALSVI